MLKKIYTFDIGVCKLHEFFSDVVISTHRIYSVGFPHTDISAYYQTLYDGQYSLVIATLPPAYRLLQSNNYLVHYISITFDCYKEMMLFCKFFIVPFAYLFRKIYDYKLKKLSTKKLVYYYEKIVDYASDVIE